jgi:hypothetical protein
VQCVSGSRFFHVMFWGVVGVYLLDVVPGAVVTFTPYSFLNESHAIYFQTKKLIFWS